MTTWAFNPLTIAAAMVCAIFLASILLPADSWDRIKDLAWRAPSLDQPVPPNLDRPMPWEKEKREREYASAVMQAQLHNAESWESQYQQEASSYYANRPEAAARTAQEVRTGAVGAAVEARTTLPKPTPTL